MPHQTQNPRADKLELAHQAARGKGRLLGGQGTGRAEAYRVLKAHQLPGRSMLGLGRPREEMREKARRGMKRIFLERPPAARALSRPRRYVSVFHSALARISIIYFRVEKVGRGRRRGSRDRAIASRPGAISLAQTRTGFRSPLMEAGPRGYYPLAVPASPSEIYVALGFSGEMLFRLDGPERSSFGSLFNLPSLRVLLFFLLFFLLFRLVEHAMDGENCLAPLWETS